MRSHENIVTDFGATRLYRALLDMGREISPSTPQRWADRNRIPAEWWPDLVAIDATTHAELRATARPRKRRSDSEQAAA